MGCSQISKKQGLTYEELREVMGESYTLEEHYDTYPEQHPYARYIEQLIEDIAGLAEAGSPFYLEDTDEEDEYDFDDADELTSLWAQESHSFISRIREMSFQEIFKIEKVALPPPETLPVFLIWDLSSAFEQLLHSYEITVVFPELDMYDLLYVWVWTVWNSNTFHFDPLGTTIEVCDKDFNDCSLQRFCKCQK